MQSSLNDKDSPNLNELALLFAEVINFLEDFWKKLALASLVGFILGLGGWLTLVGYSAEYVLLNNNSVSNGNSSPTLDIISLKSLQKSLPGLAAQIIDESKVPEAGQALDGGMESAEWWEKNVVPTYAISKADVKNLAGISKNLDSASTSILSLTFTEKGSSKEEAIQKVRIATNFFRTGGAFLEVKSLLNSYESSVLGAAAELHQKMTSAQIEMGYQKARIKSLEDLHKRFPGGPGAIGQVVDPKDSSAKYLPLATQIIAANSDIAYSKEVLSRLQDQLGQLKLARNFLDQANPLVNKSYDGLELIKQLLIVEADLRSRLASSDIGGQEFLDQLHTQLVFIQLRFSKGLEASTSPTVTKKGMLKITASGLISGFFLMLLYLLGREAWSKVKDGGLR